MYYDPADIVRVAGVVYSDSGGRRQITEIANYANNVTQCRQATIAAWAEQSQHRTEGHKCNCDVCANTSGFNSHDITHIVLVILKLLAANSNLDTQLTYLNVLDSCFGRTKIKALKVAMKDIADWPLTEASLNNHVLTKFVSFLIGL